jgi:hypothetical protein
MSQGKDTRDRLRGELPKKSRKVSIYYDVIAGALYLCLAAILYTSPPKAVDGSIVEVVMIVFGLYGVFRIGRGIYRLKSQ